MNRNNEQGEETSTRTKELWPLIHQPGDERLDRAELRVDAQHQQHDEEEDRPQIGNRQLGNRLGVDDEGQTRTIGGHLIDARAQLLGHVSEHREDHKAREKTGARTQHAGDDRITIEANNII